MEIKSKEIILIPIAEVKSNPKNRNKHPQDQIDRLVEIIKYQGFRTPITISNRSGLMVAGHGRLEAAKILGMTEVPAIFQDFDSEEQEYAHGVADNAVALWADLDLSGINIDLPDLGPDLNIEMLGLNNFQIVPPQKNEGDEDYLPERVEPRTKLGDIYKLGNHRLLCGDSTLIDDTEKLMIGKKADLCFTDPPYNADYSSRVDKSRRKPLGRILNDKMSSSDFEEFLTDINSSIWSSIKDGASVYECIDWKRYPQLADIFKEVFNQKAMIVWNKNYFGLGTFYRTKHELILFGVKGDQPITWNAEHSEMDVWDIDREKTSNYQHPTQKPVSIPERAISNSSKKGDIVLDLFGGSGSTLIACEKMNRCCFMMELDPKYCDVIVARWEKYSGKKAEHIN